MLKWFTSLVLVLALSGSVTAGVQMHVGMNMEMMDCCKAALALNNSIATQQARLCCALNCQEPAPTGSNMAQPLSSRVTLRSAPSLPLTATQELDPYIRGYQSPPFSAYSPPTYISNLALLI